MFTIIMVDWIINLLLYWHESLVILLSLLSCLNYGSISLDAFTNFDTRYADLIIIYLWNHREMFTNWGLHSIVFLFDWLHFIMNFIANLHLPVLTLTLIISFVLSYAYILYHTLTIISAQCLFASLNYGFNYWSHCDAVNIGKRESRLIMMPMML